MGDGGAGLGEAGASATASAAPNMIGDLLGSGIGVTTRSSATGAAASSSTRRSVLLSSGSFKIAENESPRPQCRVFINYDYFNNANTNGGPTFDLHREVIGFEQTCLQGNASIGMRLPLQFKDGSGVGGVDGVGDLSIIFKYAFVNNYHTGNVLSGGLVLTVPTGRDEPLADGSDAHSTLIQPWVGGIFNAGDWYAIGFSSVVIPTVTKDATFISNDIGIGFRMWRSCEDRMVTALTPTIEGHFVNALNHGNLNNGDLVGFQEGVFTVTAGVHIGLCHAATLTLAGAVPISGPRPDSFELIAQFNLNF
jgi:hypothetical protein